MRISAEEELTFFAGSSGACCCCCCCCFLGERVGLVEISSGDVATTNINHFHFIFRCFPKTKEIELIIACKC